MTNFTDRISSRVTVVGLLCGIILAQYASERYTPKFDNLPPFVLPVQVLRLVDAGLDSAAASYMWLSAIQNFGLNSGNKFGSIQAYIETVNALDPQFAHPYAFGVLVLPSLGLAGEGIDIGYRGMRVLPMNWEIPYYTGIIFHDQMDDRVRAAHLFDLVGRLPSTPDGIRSFALNYGASKDKRGQTRELWLSIQRTSNDEIVQERASLYLEHLDILDVLDKATGQYKARYGKTPKSVDDLVAGRILRFIPVDPLGLAFKYNSDGRVIAEQK